MPTRSCLHMHCETRGHCRQISNFVTLLSNFLDKENWYWTISELAGQTFKDQWYVIGLNTAISTSLILGPKMLLNTAVLLQSYCTEKQKVMNEWNISQFEAIIRAWDSRQLLKVSQCEAASCICNRTHSAKKLVVQTGHHSGLSYMSRILKSQNVGEEDFI